MSFLWYSGDFIVDVLFCFKPMQRFKYLCVVFAAIRHVARVFLLIYASVRARKNVFLNLIIFFCFINCKLQTLKMN